VSCGPVFRAGVHLAAALGILASPLSFLRGGDPPPPSCVHFHSRCLFRGLIATRRPLPLFFVTGFFPPPDAPWPHARTEIGFPYVEVHWARLVVWTSGLDQIFPLRFSNAPFSQVVVRPRLG